MIILYTFLVKRLKYYKSELNYSSSVVYRSLINERDLDIRFRRLQDKGQLRPEAPNYKVMLQHSFKGWRGLIFYSALIVAPILIVVSLPLQWIYFLIGAAVSSRVLPNDSAIVVVANTEQNLARVRRVVSEDERICSRAQVVLSHCAPVIGAELSRMHRMLVVCGHLFLVIRILSGPAGTRRDLLLHSRDALSLLALSTLARDRRDIFATHDHYQRWAFILSHSASDFRIVQHGFLDHKLKLSFFGGSVDCVYLRDLSFVKLFAQHYNVRDYKIFFNPANFISLTGTNFPLFLASSFPSIDAEIEYLRKLRVAWPEVYIILKFHPVHRYDHRRVLLSSLADVVYEGDNHPDCVLFVSHSSFMEFDYRQKGIEAISIGQCKSVVDAVQQSVDFFSSISIENEGG